MTQLIFLSMGQAEKQLKRDCFLKAMDTVIPWSRFCDLVKPHYKNERTERKRMPLGNVRLVDLMRQTDLKPIEGVFRAEIFKCPGKSFYSCYPIR